MYCKECDNLGYLNQGPPVIVECIERASANTFQLTDINMVYNYLRNVLKKVYNHLLDFAQQTVLHGPKYFLNLGTIEGGKDVKKE